MQLVFLYGQVASGKLTIARELAKLSGMALFHNHLIVDAVHAVFPFGSEAFVKLRERFWLDTFSEAAKADLYLRAGGTRGVRFCRTCQIACSIRRRQSDLCCAVPKDEQERRIMAPDRAAHGKLRSVDLLRELRAQFDASMADMPEPAITIDTTTVQPGDAAVAILAAISA